MSGREWKGRCVGARRERVYEIRGEKEEGGQALGVKRITKKK